jgi:ribonuclease Z
VDLARGADLLVHEATFLQTDPDGPAAGHSTAAEAGRIARTAGARRLLLVHLLPATVRDPAALQAEAEGTFGGGVVMIGEDLARYEV